MSTLSSNGNEDVENLETFYLINFGGLDSFERQQLRAIINYLLTFDVEEQCLQYIQSLSKDDRVIFIAKTNACPQLIPQLAPLRQVVSIYIRTDTKKPNDQRREDPDKIKEVSMRTEELTQRIKADFNERQSHKLHEHLSYSIFNTKTTSSTHLSTSMNAYFIHSQLLIDCLTNMESCSNDKNDLMILCQQQYKNNPAELSIIEEFERDYLSERSIWWYTRRSFLYRLLNKAIRVQNIDVLLLFRFFIRDIERQLKMSKTASSLRVYRGQLMSKEEVSLLLKSTGEFLSVNAFLSTSMDREQTRSLLTSSTTPDDMERVLFEISVNHRTSDVRGYGNITSSSYFPSKEEVLFMIGSLFRLIHIDRDGDGIWNIHLVLCSSKDLQKHPIIQQKRHDLEIVDTDLLSIGFILEDMENLDGAEKYYRRLLDQLPKEHEDITRCYHALGEITQKRGDFDLCLAWYNKALQADIEMSKLDDPGLATSYNSIAVVYSKKGDYSLALESYGKALEIWKKALGENHPDVAMCYNNMGIIHQEEARYADALECYHKAWNIRQQHLPADHPSVGQSNACIGNVHYQLRHYDLALEHFNLSLEVFRKSLLPHHPNIAMIYRNIGLVYQNKGDFLQALTFMQKAAAIYRQVFSPTHFDVIQIEKIMRRISSKV